jgi:hypothetical protein
MRRRASAILFMTFFVLPPATGGIAVATPYYFDAVNGSDAAAGTSPAAAWKTLAKFNATTFQPGDTVRLRAGSVWSGVALQAKGSGTNGHPIVVDSFGSATPPAMPRIDGAGVTDAVFLSGVDYWEVNHLEVTNTWAVRPGNVRISGIRLNSTGATRHHLQVNSCYVHDVNGNLTKGNYEGCGIYWDGGAFDSLIIQNCHLVNTDRDGICQNSSSRSTNGIIRGNLLENIGGDCIKFWGTNHGLIEHNVVNGGHLRATDPAAGIWPFSSDSCTIQFNEVTGMIGCNDGFAYDVDYGTKGTVMQYNYSHNNQGGFMLMCSPGGGVTDSCTRYIIRYNVSQNDGISRSTYPYPGQGYREGATFTVGGQATWGQIYNNTIYIGSHLDIPLIRLWQWNNGVPSNNLFANNIFYVDTACTASYSLETANLTNTFKHNCYYGAFISRADDSGSATLPIPVDSGAILVRPAFVSPGGAAAGLASCNAYMLKSADSRLATGMAMANNGGRDFFGNSVPSSTPPYVGADQFAPSGIAPPGPSPTAVDHPVLQMCEGKIHGLFEIRVCLSRADRATLLLVDARGETLATLFRGALNAGERRFAVDPGRFAPGVMFVKLSTSRHGFAAAVIAAAR